MGEQNSKTGGCAWEPASDVEPIIVEGLIAAAPAIH